MKKYTFLCLILFPALSYAQESDPSFSENDALKIAIKNNPAMNELRLSVTQASWVAVGCIQEIANAQI